MPEFYMTFARKILFSRIFGPCPLPPPPPPSPSPAPMHLQRSLTTFFTSALVQQAMQPLVGLYSQRRNVRLSVHPSVRLSHSGIVSERRKRHDFFTFGEPDHSSFWKYLGHHETRKGSTRERAISETGVDTNWQFWQFFDQ